MTLDLAVNLTDGMFKTTIIVVAPVIIITFLVGLMISIFQAATQINEMTLTFVPKILATAIALLIFGSWMTVELVDYTRELLKTMIDIIK